METDKDHMIQKNKELHGLYHVEGEDAKLNVEHWSLEFGKVGV